MSNRTLKLLVVSCSPQNYVKHLFPDCQIHPGLFKHSIASCQSYCCSCLFLSLTQCPSFHVLVWNWVSYRCTSHICPTVSDILWGINKNLKCKLRCSFLCANSPGNYKMQISHKVKNLHCIVSVSMAQESRWAGAYGFPPPTFNCRYVQSSVKLLDCLHVGKSSPIQANFTQLRHQLKFHSECLLPAARHA